MKISCFQKAKQNKNKKEHIFQTMSNRRNESVTHVLQRLLTSVLQSQCSAGQSCISLVLYAFTLVYVSTSLVDKTFFMINIYFN